MTTVFNFGSINVDHIYQMPHFVRPSETLASQSLQTVLGGKGANQSVALARAGATVQHIGRLSEADKWAYDLLAKNGVGVNSIDLCEEASGHAIIQVDAQGENAIVLHGGANQGFNIDQLETALSNAKPGDYLLMQNECNLIESAFEMGLSKGLKIVLNPAPMSAGIKSLPLEKLDTLVVNQIEAEMLSECQQLDEIVQCLESMLPNTRIVVTLGADGACLVKDKAKVKAESVAAEVVDTTAAGDTFVGYFLAGIINGLNEQATLEQACRAGALAVSLAGAIPSIPSLANLNS